jgi:hypothetical protein
MEEPLFLKVSSQIVNGNRIPAMKKYTLLEKATPISDDSGC